MIWRAANVRLLVLAVLVIFSAPTFSVTTCWAAGGRWPKAAVEAAERYEDGNYRGAADGYADAVQRDPRPELSYNLGNALYRGAGTDSAALATALAAYQKAAAGGDATLRTWALYNSANTSFRRGELPRAEELYREVLRRDPGDEGARYNLELVQRLLEGQQQSSQGGEQGKNDDQDPSEDDGQDKQQGNQQDNQQDKPQDQQQSNQQDKQDEQEEQQGNQQDDQQEGEQGNQQGQHDQPNAPTRPPSEDEDQSPPGENPPAEAGPQAESGTVPESPISPEEARRQLEKLDEAERALLRQLLRSRQRRIDVERDW